MLRVGTQPMREAISMQSVMEYPYAPSWHAPDEGCNQHAISHGVPICSEWARSR